MYTKVRICIIDIYDLSVHFKRHLMSKFIPLGDASPTYNVSISTLRRAIDKMSDDERKKHTRKGNKNRIEVDTEWLNTLFGKSTGPEPSPSVDDSDNTHMVLVSTLVKQNERLNNQIEQLTERIRELTHLLAMEKNGKQLQEAVSDEGPNRQQLLFFVLFILLIMVFGALTYLSY